MTSPHDGERGPTDQRYYQLLEELPLIVYSVDPTPPYAPLYVSRGIEALGYSREEWLEVPDRWLRSIHAEDRDRVIAQTDRAMTNGWPLDYVYRLIAGDGTVRWVHDRGSFLRDAAGRPVEWRGIMVDITARRNAELALAESEDRYRELVESSPDAVVVHTGGRIQFVNPAAVAMLGGSSRKDLIGKRVIDFVHPDSRSAATAAIRSVTEAGTPAPALEETLVRLDGTSFEAEVGAVKIVFHGAPAVQVIARDVSARRRSERALRQAEDELRHAQRVDVVGRLAGGLAHDFNNLLTVIMSHTDFVKDRVAHDSALAEEMAEIHRAAERAADLTRQLLAFGRRQVLRPETLDLNDVIRGGFQMMRRIVPENILMTMELDPHPPVVRADRGQLEQVLANLIVNARDAMPEGGSLRVITSATEAEPSIDAAGEPVAAGRYASFSVVDTGIGMDDATRGRAMEPFFTTKPMGLGTGLGLSSVQGIVKQSGGFVKITSAPGLGTEVLIGLPLLDAKRQP